MFKKAKDVVMTIGSKAKNFFKSIIDHYRDQKSTQAVSNQPVEKSIEGEFLGKGGLILAGTLAFAGNALADVPAAVTTAITTAVTDVTTIGTAILGVVVVIAAFFWMRKPIK